MMNDLINQLYWREPWLLLLMAFPVLFVLFNRFLQKWQWHTLADESLHPWLQARSKTTNSLLPIIFLALAWVCLSIALAGPRFVNWLPPEQQAEPTSLVVIFDLSASMNAEDAYPSRKAQALQWLQKNNLNKPKHLKIGLILFAGHAFNLMPPTLDTSVIEHFIKQLGDLPLPTLGNDLTAALVLAKQQFKTNEQKQHIIVLTDGDLSKDEQNRAHLFIKNELSDLSITFIGFGGNKAVKIPQLNADYVQVNGRPVQSRLEETWLKQMSTYSHVTYKPIAQAQQQSIKQTIGLSAMRINKRAQQHVIWQELFPYPLLFGIGFLFISLWRVNHHPTVPVVLTGVITLMLFSHSPPSLAANDSLFQQANTALNAQHYKPAQTLFSQSDSPIAAFGEGIACYRQKNFNCATRAFSKVAWQAKTDKLKANAVFNLANSYFFLGEYDQASVLFKDAENLGFDAKTAKNNLAFSNIMQQSVLQRVKDIKEIFRRAKWRAAVAGNPAPLLSTIISEQNNLSLDTKNKPQNFLVRQALAQQVNKQLGITNGLSSASSQWVKTENIANQSSAQLLKRLLEMKLAIPASLKEPQAIKGKRQW